MLSISEKRIMNRLAVLRAYSGDLAGIHVFSILSKKHLDIYLGLRLIKSRFIMMNKTNQTTRSNKACIIMGKWIL